MLFSIFSCSALERKEITQLILAMFAMYSYREVDAPKTSAVFGSFLSFMVLGLCFKV